MTARNCAAYVEEAIASVARQSLTDLHLLFVDDASTDDTCERATASLSELLPGRHTIRRNSVRRGKAASAGTHLRDFVAGSTFVAVVDADDQLVAIDVLERLAERYAVGFDVVWTNYATDRGDVGGNRALNAFGSPRVQGWVTSHLFSFRSILWERVPDSYLQDEHGRWVTAAADIAMALPVLDQTRRYAHLPVVGYRYTVTNPLSHHNRDPQPGPTLGSRAQVKIAADLQAREPLDCWRYPAELPAVLHEVIGESLVQHAQAIAMTQAGLRQTSAKVDRIPRMLAARHRLMDVEGVPGDWLDGVGGWSMDVELLDRIAATLSLYASPRVLEMGSGAGTRVLAALVKNRGGRLATLEHDRAWRDNTTSSLKEAGLAATARVHLCPLVPVETFGIRGRCYDMQRLPDDETFDVVVVDGPPTVTNPLARVPALPAISSRLNPQGFHLFLDDYDRPDERQTLEIWRANAPDLQYDILSFDKDVAVVRSSSSPPAPMP